MPALSSIFKDTKTSLDWLISDVNRALEVADSVRVPIIPDNPNQQQAKQEFKKIRDYFKERGYGLRVSAYLIDSKTDIPEIKYYLVFRKK